MIGYMSTLSPAGGEAPWPVRSRQAVAWLRPLGEQLLYFGARLAWALFILFVIAYVAFAGLEMARGLQPLDALVSGKEFEPGKKPRLLACNRDWKRVVSMRRACPVGN